MSIITMSIAEFDGKLGLEHKVATAQVVTVVMLPDNNDSFDGKYFRINGKDLGLAETHYVWFNSTVGAAADPDPDSGGTTGLGVVFDPDDDADTMATKAAAVINGDAAFGATAINNVVTITNAATGVALAAAAGDSGLNPIVKTKGHDLDERFVVPLTDFQQFYSLPQTIGSQIMDLGTNGATTDGTDTGLADGTYTLDITLGNKLFNVTWVEVGANNLGAMLGSINDQIKGYGHADLFTDGAGDDVIRFESISTISIVDGTTNGLIAALIAGSFGSLVLGAPIDGDRFAFADHFNVVWEPVGSRVSGMGFAEKFDVYSMLVLGDKEVFSQSGSITDITNVYIPV